MLLSKRMTALFLSTILTGSMICAPVMAAETPDSEMTVESPEDKAEVNTGEDLEKEGTGNEAQQNEIGDETQPAETGNEAQAEETVEEAQPKEDDIQEVSQEESAIEHHDVSEETDGEADVEESTENAEDTEDTNDAENNDDASDYSNTADEQSDTSGIEDPNDTESTEPKKDESRVLKAPLKAGNNVQSAESARSISVGESVQVSVSENAPYVFLKYIPEETGLYEFYSTSESELDPIAYLYGEDIDVEYDSDDDSYGNGNFKISSELEAGNTYYFKVQLYDTSKSGSFTVHLTKNPFYVVEGSYTSGITLGGEADFSVISYADNPLTYQWYDTNDEIIDGANSSSYSFITDKVGNFTLHCKVTDGEHSKDLYFDLEVYGYLYASAVCEEFMADPGEEITLEVKVDAYDDSNLRYVWYKDGQEGYKKIEGANGNSIKITADQKCNYECRVEDLNSEYDDYFDEYKIRDTAYFSVNINNNLVVYPEGASTDSNGHKSSTITYDLKESESISLKTIVECNDTEGLTYKWSQDIEHGAWGWPHDDETDLNCNNDTLELDTPQTGTYTCTVTDRFGNKAKAVFNISLESINNLSIYPEGAGTTNGERDKYARPQYKSSGTLTLNVIVSAEDTSKLTYEWYKASFVETGWNKIKEFSGKSSVTVDNGRNSIMYKCVVADQYGNHDYAYFEIVKNNLRLTSANGEVEHENDNPSYITLWKNPGEDLTLKTIATADDTSKISYRWDSYSWDIIDSHDYYSEIDWGVGETDSYVVTNDFPGRYDCIVSDGYGNSFFIVYKVKIACNTHSFGNWTVTKEATAVENGLKERTCTVCGYTEKEEIPAEKKVGWNEDSNGWSYVRADGTSPKSMFEVINSKTYYFNENGYRVTGLQQIDTSKYYFDNYGVMKTGWQTIDSSKYYFDKNGAAHIGWLQIGDKWYFFRQTGVMHTGMLKKGSTYYYLEKSGVRHSGWLQVSGKLYYFKTNGQMLTGWLQTKGKKYYFKTNGQMLTGWLQVKGKKFYFKANGQMLTGWLKLNGKFYYFKETGQMVTGRYKIGTKWYTFNKNGIRQ